MRLFRQIASPQFLSLFSLSSFLLICLLAFSSPDAAVADFCGESQVGHPCHANPFPNVCCRELAEAREAVEEIDLNSTAGKTRRTLQRLGEPHPWLESGGSEETYRADGEKIRGAMEGLLSGRFGSDRSQADIIRTCVEPTLVKDSCEYCQPATMGRFVDSSCSRPFRNRGMVIQYWWPELIIEINNYGISAINVSQHGKPHLHYNELLKQTQTVTREVVKADLKKTARKLGGNADAAVDSTPDIGPVPPFSGTTTVGTDPRDETERREAHIYSTPFQDELTRNYRDPGKIVLDLVYVRVFGICVPSRPFAYNGLFRGNPEGCFYNIFDKLSSCNVCRFTLTTKFFNN